MLPTQLTNYAVIPNFLDYYILGYTVEGVRTNETQPYTIYDLTADSNVIIFGLPGAFTPTCSKSHLPMFEQMYDSFIDLGVNEIYCTSMDNPFVMRAWFEHLGIEKVKSLPDPRGTFARKMFQSTSNFSHNKPLGDYSWRYSAYYENGELVLGFEEDREDLGDPFSVSKAEHMYEAISKLRTERG